MALIHALARIKSACARVNHANGLLPARTAQAIMSAADEILCGQHDEEFPLRVWQTGSGTQTNMNLNEVLANRASELLGGTRGEGRLVHPNDEVNKSQSSNDVFPSAMNLAAVTTITQHLLPALATLSTTLAGKAAAFDDIVKIGRTHLQDATPLTLGQEFSGWVAQLEQGSAISGPPCPICASWLWGHRRRHRSQHPPGFAEAVAATLAEQTGLPLMSAPTSSRRWPPAMPSSMATAPSRRWPPPS